MHTTHHTVLIRAHLLAATILLFGVTRAVAQTGGAAFGGPYVGLDLSMQHVIGGALVDGVDTLSEGSRPVTSVVAGFRVPVTGFVLGAELGYGRVAGGLTLEDAARALAIDYRLRRQWHWLLSAGHGVGRRTLLFVYVSEVSRTFDVSAVRAATRVAQRDEQGMLRFGGGLEHILGGPLRLRVTAGSGRADFGGRVTNIAPARRAEAGLALIVRF